MDEQLFDEPSKCMEDGKKKRKELTIGWCLDLSWCPYAVFESIMHNCAYHDENIKNRKKRHIFLMINAGGNVGAQI
jgi:hypothetical protein